MCTQGVFESCCIHLAASVVAVVLFSSCGVATQQVSQRQPVDQSVQDSSTLDVLNRAHEEWQGTPYILGGTGIGGVDCSSFIQIVFKDYFGKPLPRNTRQQLQEGSSVRRNFIRPGDLIFFRTGRNLLHVGIAMDDGRFLHASVSSGVMISRLDQRYWAARYLASRRVM